MSPKTLEMLRRYSKMLFKTNQTFNLSGLRSLEDIEQQLVFQSAGLLAYMPVKCKRFLDVGSGGGIPGLPVAICCPNIDVKLIDATAKKVNFINSAAATLKLHNVEAVHGRAEELGQNSNFREQFDVVAARALAAMPTLIEYTLPFLKQGGIALFPKGPDPQAELALSEHAIGELGGRLCSVNIDNALGGSLVIISKVDPTPHQYPRHTGIPGKRPIGVPL